MPTRAEWEDGQPGKPLPAPEGAAAWASAVVAGSSPHPASPQTPKVREVDQEQQQQPALDRRQSPETPIRNSSARPTADAQRRWVFPLPLKLMTMLAELVLVVGVVVTLIRPTSGSGLLAAAGACLVTELGFVWYRVGWVAASKLMLWPTGQALKWGGIYLLMSLFDKLPALSASQGRQAFVGFPLSGDRVLGDGGNTTVYGRPDGTQYALDRSGRGAELPRGTRILGPAKFDSRPHASGRWTGSRSRPG